MSAQDAFRARRTVQINYDEFAEDEDRFVHEGRYVPDGLLPFRIEDCAGTRFRMDGTGYILLGDLGGHAVYRRRNDSTVRTMDWEEFATAYERNHITI